MVAITLVLCGLVFDIIGVLILAYGETSHLAAFARYTRSSSEGDRWDSEVARHPCWSRPLIRLGARIGSRNPEHMGDAGPLEGMATRLLGYAIIFLGFILQGIGALATLR